jgi:DNA-binding MarR family transcriptional regulator
MTIPNTRLSDPIAEARRQWVEHGWADASTGMAIVTSITRAEQLFLKTIDAELRPFDLSFSRYEFLRLLAFTRQGALPLSKASARLQVHPTTVTSTVDRLEDQGFVQRVPHPTDRRTTLVEILPEGRRVVDAATSTLNAAVFASLGLSESEASSLLELLTRLRAAHGDLDEKV